MKADGTRLDEYDKDEWRSVAKRFMPGLTEQEYDAMWQEFVQMKAERQRKMGLQ